MNLIPKKIDPIKLAKQKGTITGQLPLSLCPRIQEMAEQQNQYVSAVFEFAQNKDRIYVIHGKLNTVVTVVCQRCNQLMQEPLEIECTLSPVTSDERAKTLPGSIDPVLMEADQIDLHALIEDEVLLALPMVPKHEQCE